MARKISAWSCWREQASVIFIAEHLMDKMMHIIFFVSLLLGFARPAACISADQVRALCINAFELAFPPQRWTMENDLRAFTANVSTDPTLNRYFACPLGGGPGSELVGDFTGGDLLDWFLKSFNPNELQ